MLHFNKLYNMNQATASLEDVQKKQVHLLLTTFQQILTDYASIYCCLDESKAITPTGNEYIKIKKKLIHHIIKIDNHPLFKGSTMRNVFLEDSHSQLNMTTLNSSEHVLLQLSQLPILCLTEPFFCKNYAELEKILSAFLHASQQEGVLLVTPEYNDIIHMYALFLQKKDNLLKIGILDSLSIFNDETLIIDENSKNRSLNTDFTVSFYTLLVCILYEEILKKKPSFNDRNNNA